MVVSAPQVTVMSGTARPWAALHAAVPVCLPAAKDTMQMTMRTSMLDVAPVRLDTMMLLACQEARQHLR